MKTTARSFPASCNAHRAPQVVCGMLAWLCILGALFGSAEPIPASGSKLAIEFDKTITAADVTLEQVGASIPATAIGEPNVACHWAPPVEE